MNIETKQFTYVSDSCYRVMGYTQKEMLNMSVASVLTEDSIEKLLRVVYKIIAHNIE
jgi:PAS domain S-box-containing protein